MIPELEFTSIDHQLFEPEIEWLREQLAERRRGAVGFAGSHVGKIQIEVPVVGHPRVNERGEVEYVDAHMRKVWVNIGDPMPEGGRVMDPVPPLPGEVLIPEGHVRLFHVTPLRNAEDIKVNGLKVSSSKGESYGEPTQVWASSGLVSAQAKRVLSGELMDSEFAVVEFHAPVSDLDIGSSSDVATLEARGSDVTLRRDVPPGDIIAVHEPWEAAYRSLMENATAEQVRAGEYDYVADIPAYGKAIEVIKAESGDPVTHPSGITKRELPIPISETLRSVMAELDSKGQRALIVGGAVRDAMLGVDSKDIDVEVYSASYEDLEAILSQHGQVNLVGKAFGVIKFTDPEGNEYDFSIPRRDNKAGIGHKDFTVEFDPTITFEEAASRRDFTFNAIAYDPIAGELHDYFGGEADLKAGLIHHTSDAFAEDPLRVLRGMQFAARFDMTLAPDTAELTRSISDQYETLPTERVSEEWMKLVTRGVKPSAGMQFLADAGWLEHFPELSALVGTEQDPEWHPEGDAWTHSKHAADAAAALADTEGITGDERAVLVFASMLHDVGKPSTSQYTAPDESAVPRITSHGHDQAGGPLAKSFLRSIGIKSDIADKVVPLVEQHMQHINFMNTDPTPRAIRRLAQRLRPATIHELVNVMYADASGRPPLPTGTPDAAMKLFDMAQRDGVLNNPPMPLIMGRDIMPFFDDVGGRHIGIIQKLAFEAQMEGEFTTGAEAMEWLRTKMRTPFAELSESYLRELADGNGPLAARARRELDVRTQRFAVDAERERHAAEAAAKFSELFGDEPQGFWMTDSVVGDVKRQRYIEAAYQGEIRNLSGGEPSHFDVSLTRASSFSTPGYAHAEGLILNPDTGVMVGEFDRLWRDDGSVLHNRLMLIEGTRGQGIAEQLNGRAEAFYRAAGFDRVTLLANSTVGGYARATQGYQWDELPPSAIHIRIGTALAGEHNLSPGEQERAERYRTQLRLAIQSRAITSSTPTPFDIASLGRDTKWVDESGREMWFGKKVLLGSSWNGVKRLSQPERPAVEQQRSRFIEEAEHVAELSFPDGYPHGAIGDTATGEAVMRYFEQAFDHELADGTKLKPYVEVRTEKPHGGHPTEQKLVFRADIWRAGQQVGKAEWLAYTDGTARMHDVEFDNGVQGQGIAQETNARAEAYLKAAGFSSIAVYADITVGGYAWAVQGYGWDDTLSNRFSVDIRKLVGQLERAIATDAFKQGGEPVKGAVLSAGDQALAREYMAALLRAAEAGYLLPDTPTPMDIAALGRDNIVTVPIRNVFGEQTGERQLWWGKVMLLGRKWNGRKSL